MEWEVEYTDEFEQWWDSLDVPGQTAVGEAVERLLQRGPALGRPTVDTIKSSRHSNMKELRPARGSIRVLIAFDPRRMAILLIGGDKRGQWNAWYAEMIPIADHLYDEHLKTLRMEREILCQTQSHGRNYGTSLKTRRNDESLPRNIVMPWIQPIHSADYLIIVRTLPSNPTANQAPTGWNTMRMRTFQHFGTISSCLAENWKSTPSFQTEPSHWFPRRGKTLMPKTRPFSELRAKLPDTPESRMRSEQRRRAIEVSLVLGKLCDEHETAPTASQSPSDTQPAKTSIEHEEDVYLATLRESVEMLGGTLEINAVFPDQTVTHVPAETPE